MESILTMKLLLTAVLLALSPVPANAITWNEFWRPFTHNEHHKHHHNQSYCTTTVRREQYVPGNRWRSGYIRVWYERVPCYR